MDIELGKIERFAGQISSWKTLEIISTLENLAKECEETFSKLQKAKKPCSGKKGRPVKNLRVQLTPVNKRTKVPKF